MIDLDELKDDMQDPEFRLMIKSGITNLVKNVKNSAEHDVKNMLDSLKGTSVKISQIPDLIESFSLFDFILENKAVAGGLLDDLNTKDAEIYIKEFLNCVAESEK